MEPLQLLSVLFLALLHFHLSLNAPQVTHQRFCPPQRFHHHPLLETRSHIPLFRSLAPGLTREPFPNLGLIPQWHHLKCREVSTSPRQMEWERQKAMLRQMAKRRSQRHLLLSRSKRQKLRKRSMIPWCIWMAHKSTPAHNAEHISLAMTTLSPRASTVVTVRLLLQIRHTPWRCANTLSILLLQVAHIFLISVSMLLEDQAKSDDS